jgi:predicted RNA-binding Zn-ribbon protein involved in translation (DUF1610 family)
MPRDTAIQKLDQISRWKNEIPDAHADLIGLRSTWQIGGIHGETAADRLPHGLDNAFDDVDTLGPTGIRTEHGVMEMLDSLCTMVSGHTGSQITNAYLLREVLWQYPEHFWHAWAEWETFTDELATTWAVIARLTGRSSVTVATCPECGGRIRAHMTRDGQSDTARCAGCGAMYDLTNAGWEAALLQRLRDPEISRNVLVTHQQLRTIHPRVRSGTIRNWRYLQKISKPATDGRLILAEINAILCYRDA